MDHAFSRLSQPRDTVHQIRNVREERPRRDLQLCFISVLLATCFYGFLRWDDFLTHILSGGLLGLIWMQVAYLGHDSGHNNIMISPRFNKLAQILTGNCITGISIACNSLDYDPDLQHLPMLAVSTLFFTNLTSKFYNINLEFYPIARFFISYQHLTYFPVVCVARVNLYLQTFILLLSNRRVPDRALNILGIMIFWTWFPLPVSCLPNWTERVLFVLASFCVCAIQHIQFTLNHFTADVYVGPPKRNNWFEKQTAGTIDIKCPSWMDWFFGGLQFQLEHHLFPRLLRCHLRKVSPIIKDLYKKHNLPYRSLTFVEANKWTL
ncbi:hypothetical protein SASPL_110607 [Salvia splendens]|uniref:Fatty acid desaturase domain-containing protein n=1 Tax=Salvia splendens TaxID=180675 RepID=A0A8X8Y809_SALSN|nr:hypothetical protein SASPL_110607 [Salvia splendens]